MNSTREKLIALNQRTHAANTANKALEKVNLKIDAKEKEIAQVPESATGKLGKFRERLVKELTALATVQNRLMIDLEHAVEGTVAAALEGGEKGA
jgi:cation transport regulator ChaC